MHALWVLEFQIQSKMQRETALKAIVAIISNLLDLELLTILIMASKLILITGNIIYKSTHHCLNRHSGLRMEDGNDVE